jgi:large subunit ribosomal protein L17
LMSNLASSLVIHKRIRTTDAKAKEVRGFVERLVTYAKKGDVHGRRLIMQKINGTLGKKIANILIHDIAPVYKTRQGGYTRIIKLNNRKNDNAPVSMLEFVDIAPETNEVEETVEETAEAIAE